MHTLAKPTTFKIPVTTEIPIERVSDLLCSAFEGGSNYWYQIEKYIEPVNFNNSEAGDETFRHLSFPINEGGALIISADEGEVSEDKTYRLDLETIKKGLEIMAKDYPSHFNDFLQDGDDACTGDVFLQCCLFGEVIFG